MMVPYSSPNLRLVDLIKAIQTSDTFAEKTIKDYFSQLTGKKYILITNSCRTALYLANSALGKQGEVITSPLTCKVAIDPIVESGNVSIFTDINPGDLNMLVDDIEHRITNKTIAIQAIHLGGVSCNMDRIKVISKKHNLPVIEDCAQSLGATYQGKATGSFGDAACFSLIKNAYGIGGGVLATDSREIYQKALSACANFKKPSSLLLLFRILRNLIETQRKNNLGRILYKVFLLVKGKKQSYSLVVNQLKRITNIEKKIAAYQIQRYPELHQKRKLVGKEYVELLKGNNMMLNADYDPDASSFTKLFVYHPSIDSISNLLAIKSKGIEAMHLEQKSGNPFQPRMVTNDYTQRNRLVNYDKVHDSILSLPLTEQMDSSQIEAVVKNLEFLQKEDTA